MLVQKTLQYITETGMIKKGDRVLLALSGGADSVCLFLVLEQLAVQMGFALEAVHVEHGIRGEESIGDADFVKTLCDKHQIRCHVRHVDVPGFAEERHMGLEEAARWLRYEAFEDVARLCGGTKVALAHHMEDNAETVLFRLCRGSGIGGLQGMEPVRAGKNVRYVRPLLLAGRGEILAWLGQQGQEYCTDSTNEDTAYARNCLRKNVLPELREINPGAIRHINEASRQMAEIIDYMSGQVRQAAGELLTEDERGIWVDIPGLLTLHTALQRQILFLALEQAAGRKKDLMSVHVAGLMDLCRGQSGRGIDLPYRLRASRIFDLLLLEKPGLSVCRPEVVVVETGGLGTDEPEKVVQLPDGREIILVLQEHKEDFQKIPKKRYTKWLDYDKIGDRLEIRHRQPGDYLTIEDGHRKKLKKLFTEEKVPPVQRRDMWLLADGQRILWAVGSRISQDCRVTAETKYMIRVTYRGAFDGLQQET